MSAQTQETLSVEDVQTMITNSRKGTTTVSAQEILERIVARAEAKKVRNAEKPTPLSVNPSDGEKKAALELSYDTDNLIVRYVRDEPTVSTTVDKETGKKTYSIAKGAPHAALVAFLYNDRLTLGWAKLNGKVLLEGTTVVPFETNAFTKEGGRYLAILRGLTDSVVVESKSNVRTGAAGKPIPGCVVRELGSFIARARKYFKTDNVVNLIGNM